MSSIPPTQVQIQCVDVVDILTRSNAIAVHAIIMKTLTDTMVDSDSMEESMEISVEAEVINMLLLEDGLKRNVEMEILRDGENHTALQIVYLNRIVTVSMNTRREESVEDISLKDAELRNSLREETRGTEMMDTVEITNTRLTRIMEENGDMEETDMPRITVTIISK